VGIILTIYSFSRLETFLNCRRSYFYTYILGQRGGENIYSFLGTICHTLAQDMIEGKESNENAVDKFVQAVDDADILCLEWISEKVKNNYKECIIHFFENYIPEVMKNYKIEEYFEVDINGVMMKGYIDLWYFKNGEIHICDLKTSSKYSKKDLLKKQRQLYLYAYALNKQYPNNKINLYFNMLKYVIQNNKLIERNKCSIFEDFSDGFIKIKYDDIAKKDIENYVLNTVDEIELLDKDIIFWDKNYEPEKDFFCVNLCSYRNKCLVE